LVSAGAGAADALDVEPASVVAGGGSPTIFDPSPFFAHAASVMVATVATNGAAILRARLRRVMRIARD
jgi:hypothetical protein